MEAVVPINTGDIEMKILKPLLGVVLSSIMALSAHAQQAAITLHGASQFGDDHAFTKTMVKFEELVKKYPFQVYPGWRTQRRTCPCARWGSSYHSQQCRDQRLGTRWRQLGR